MQNAQPATEPTGFVAAMRDLFAHDLDRDLLITLVRAGKTVGYEELRHAADDPHQQTFKDAIDRLIDHVAIYRHLEPHGKAYRTFFSPSPRGLLLVKILTTLSRDGHLPTDLPAEVRRPLETWLVAGHTSPA